MQYIMKKRIIVQLLNEESAVDKKLFFERGSDVAAVVILRKNMNKYSNLNELTRHNLYLLINTNSKQIYVGETRGFAGRSIAHKNKDRAKLDWDMAIVLAKNSDQAKLEFEKGHVQYFEYLAYEQLKIINSCTYTLVNDQPVKAQYINPSSKEGLKEDFRCFTELLATINIFPFESQKGGELSKKTITNDDVNNSNPSTKQSRGSFLRAASSILSDNKKPMHYKEITELAIKQGLVHSQGKTPWNTMSARLITDIKGGTSRFIRTDPGVFYLANAKIPIQTKPRSLKHEASTLIGRNTLLLDTVVVPARAEGFENRFIKENIWWAIRISEGMLDKLRYIAAYRVSPISAITHWAEIKQIEPYGNEGKYKLFFKEPAQKLREPIGIQAKRNALQGPKYTSFQKLMQAKDVSEL